MSKRNSFPEKEDKRPTQPYLPPLPHTAALSGAAASSSRALPPTSSNGSSSSTSAKPFSGRPSLSGSIPTIPNHGTPLNAAKGKAGEAEVEEEETRMASVLKPPSQIPSAAPASPHTPPASATENGAPPRRGAPRTVGLLGRARGMKPLLLRTAAQSPAPPATANTDGTSADRAYASADAIDNRPVAAPDTQNVALLNNERRQPHPPSTDQQQRSSPLFRRTLWRHSGDSASSPAMPDHLDTVPAVYRQTALQFTQAIERLNKMTAVTCEGGDTTSLEFVGSGIASHNKHTTLHAAYRTPSPPPPPPDLRAAARQPMPNVHGLRNEENANRVRKLTQVSLLPLTLCTDGTTVVLLDRNGSARHGNYLHAVETYLQHYTQGMEKSKEVTDTPPPTARVLWWTLGDLGREEGCVSFSSAQATCSSRPQTIASTDEACNNLKVAPPADRSTPFEVSSESRKLLTSTLRLPYERDGLVLVLTDVPLPSAEGDSSALNEQGESNEHDVSPDLSQQQRVSSFVQSFLSDIRQGYLPSLLEAAYPNGGVALRGCWCNVANEQDGQHSQQQQQQNDERIAADKSAVESEVLIATIAEPLVHARTHHASQPSTQRDSAAVAARTMRSLIPTSLPASHESEDVQETVTTTASAELVLHLPDTVLRFFFQSSKYNSPLRAKETREGLSASQTKKSLSPIPSFSHDGSEPPAPREAPASAGASSHAIAEAAAAETSDAPSKEHKEQEEEDRDAAATAVIEKDKRDITELPHTTADVPAMSNASLVFVSPLFRADPVGAAVVSATITETAGPPSGAHAEGGSSASCQSVTVLTPVGRVEFVVPGCDPSDKDTGTLSTAPVTIGDVKTSLLRSAVGQSLRLREAEVGFVYGPSSPILAETEVVKGTRVVLRLRRRSAYTP